MIKQTKLRVYEKTMLAFDIEAISNGSTQELIGDVSLIIKANKSDTDAQALLTSEAIDYSENKARFAFDMNILPGSYFYEIRWTNGTSQYVLISDTIEVLERVYD